MPLWWARRDQLDQHQVQLIENLELRESHLVLGPPGSGKTNVLLRRAQFVRSQNMPNIMVMTFTRALTEFIKTGCYDAQGREIFPRSCVTTFTSWMRRLYEQHNVDVPQSAGGLDQKRTDEARGAFDFSRASRVPRYDALFIDEAQDLLPEEIELFRMWSPVLFFVGDDRQRIYENTSGLDVVREFVPLANQRTLPFHYRLVPEICAMADQILVPQGGGTLSSTQHYNGPRPGRIGVVGPLVRDELLRRAAERLRDQVRAYSDLIREGDFLGVVVARQNDRDVVIRYLENDPELAGKSQIVRARSGTDDDHDPAIKSEAPICILTVKGCKGLEFRAVHWLFCEELANWHSAEHYYTVVTRAKTSLDLYFSTQLPQELTRAYAPPAQDLW